MAIRGKKVKYSSPPRIHGVEVKRLVMHCDESGGLMELLRSDDSIFKKFGQCYVSITYPGVVKAWHYHKKQWDYMAVVKGMSKIVLYDPRDDSPTKGVVNEFFLGEQSNVLVSIPPLVLHGQKPYGNEPSYLINFPSEPFNASDPDEYRLDPLKNDIPYDWSLKQG